MSSNDVRRRKKILYKYTSTQGIKYVLENGELCFTSAMLLNDPFEVVANMEPFVARSKERFPFGRYEIFHRYNAWKVASFATRKIGILSLSKSPKQILMWSHYGDSLGGLAFGFDAGTELLSKSTFGEIKGPRQVDYVERRINIDRPLNECLRSMVLSKAKCWEYEQEVRCLRELDGSEDRRIMPFSPDSLVQIILGPRLGIEYIRQCFEIRKERYPKATILLAVPNPTEFAIDLIPAITLRQIETMYEVSTPEPILPLTGDMALAGKMADSVH